MEQHILGVLSAEVSGDEDCKNSKNSWKPMMWLPAAVTRAFGVFLISFCPTRRVVAEGIILGTSSDL